MANLSHFPPALHEQPRPPKPWDAHKHFFNIAWIDIVCSCENKILLAINYRKEAILVHTRQVTRVQPSILQYFTRLTGLVPISLHDLWTTNNQFPHLPRDKRLACLYINNARIGPR